MSALYLAEMPIKETPFPMGFEVGCLVLYMSKITIFGPANYLGLMHHGHNARH